MPRDLYDALEVARDASPDELRVAYRRLALVWHPDKNAGRQGEATVRFKEIQNAYEVLSDKNERAWYDAHREEILRGGRTYYAGAETGAPQAEEGIDRWAYFSTSAFSGYGDTGQGFYSVYGKVFDEIAKNEMQAARRTGLDFTSPPSLGTFSSPYSAVSSFYSHWLNFTTVKEFLWAAEYNLAAAPNRQVRRLMETENAKKVRAMRKKFNEEVRALAAWCKKRDKRVMERALEQKKLQAVREQEEARAHREKLARKKAEAAAMYVEQDWAVNEGAEKLTDEGWWGDAPKEKEGGEEEFYCVACGKSFKSEKQWKNHEKSRKHLERAAILKEALLQEEEDASAASEDEVPDDFDTASEGDDVTSTRDDVIGEDGDVSKGRGPVTDEEILAELDAQEAERSRRSELENGEEEARPPVEDSEEEESVGDDENGSRDGAEESGSEAESEDGLGDLMRMQQQRNSKGGAAEERRGSDNGTVSGDASEESGSEPEEDGAESGAEDDDGLGDLLRLHKAQNGAGSRKKRGKRDGSAAGGVEESVAKERETEANDVEKVDEEPDAADVAPNGAESVEKASEVDAERNASDGTGEVLKDENDEAEAPQRDTAKAKKARRAANRAKKEGAQAAEVAPEVTLARGRKGKKGKGSKVRRW